MDIGNLSLGDFPQRIMISQMLNPEMTYIFPLNLATGQENGKYATFCINLWLKIFQPKGECGEC